MAASVDAAARATAIDVAGVVTWSHTISASATLIVIFVGWSETTTSANGEYISDIKVGATSCNFQSQIVNGYVMETWYLASPPTGSQLITVTWLDASTNLPSVGGKVSGQCGSVSFLSTDTSFPIVRNTTRVDRRGLRIPILHGGAFEPASFPEAVTTLQTASANNFLVDGLIVSDTTIAGPAIVVGGNQTQQWNAGAAGLADGTNFQGGGSTRGGSTWSGAAKVPMRWALQSSTGVPTAAKFAQSVIEVKGV